MVMDSIYKIQINLHAEAEKKDFYLKSEHELNEGANAFVEDFCLENDLASHTISPMCWSFESAKHGIFDDGVIELTNVGKDGTTAFEYVDVSDAKVTDPD